MIYGRSPKPQQRHIRPLLMPFMMNRAWWSKFYYMSFRCLFLICNSNTARVRILLSLENQYKPPQVFMNIPYKSRILSCILDYRSGWELSFTHHLTHHTILFDLFVHLAIIYHFHCNTVTLTIPGLFVLALCYSLHHSTWVCMYSTAVTQFTCLYYVVSLNIVLLFVRVFRLTIVYSFVQTNHEGLLFGKGPSISSLF